MPTSADAALQAVRNYLHDSITDPTERAQVLLDIIRTFCDFTKFNAPGGEGLDGRDGPERTGIGDILAVTDQHWLMTANRS